MDAGRVFVVLGVGDVVWGAKNSAGPVQIVPSLRPNLEFSLVHDSVVMDGPWDPCGYVVLLSSGARSGRPRSKSSESAGVAEVHELPDRVVLVGLDQITSAIP